MTAPAFESVLEEFSKFAKPCECTAKHAGTHCDHEAIYAVRIRHMSDCGQVTTPLLCQICFDDHIESAKDLLGAICTVCGFRVSSVSDMVGPVIPV